MEWITFPVYPTVFHLRTQSHFDGPEYWGGLFRGGFGKYFRDLVCITRATSCTGCAHLERCSYAKVFETPVHPEKMAVLRKYPNAPHPFVLRPPDRVERVAPGALMELGVLFIGPGLHYLPHFIQVFDDMGRGGRFGGRFRVESVSHGAGGAGEAVFSGGRIRNAPAAWIAPPDPGGDDPLRHPLTRSVQLQFRTPLRMRTEGRYNVSPDFGEVARALLRRVSLLEALYGTGDFRDRVRELMQVADTFETVRAEFRVFEWSRQSGRQHRRIAMDGVVGELEVRGFRFKEWVRLLRLGELIHIGNGTSMGLGRYEATIGGM